MNGVNIGDLSLALALASRARPLKLPLSRLSFALPSSFPFLPCPFLPLICSSYHVLSLPSQSFAYSLPGRLNDTFGASMASALAHARKFSHDSRCKHADTEIARAAPVGKLSHAYVGVGEGVGERALEGARGREREGKEE